MAGLSAAAQGSVFFIPDMIFQKDFYAIIFFHCHLNRYFFPVPCHGVIGCLHRQYRADHTCGFHFVIIHTEICQIIAPAFLEPADIVGMMHASHLIGFIILHPMVIPRVLFCPFHLCLFPFCPIHFCSVVFLHIFAISILKCIIANRFLSLQHFYFQKDSSFFSF